MINLTNIYLQYGDRILFDKVNVTIPVNAKIGLVGRNGMGKSTIFRIIAGHQKPDEGVIDMPKNSSIGYLHQDMDLPSDKTVIDETMTAFNELLAYEKRLDEIHKELEVREDYESDEYHKILEEMADINDILIHNDVSQIESKTERILKGLGFKPSDFQKRTATLSGGWKMRIELAKILLRMPSYVLLDEPTNHLDIESIIWLEGFLKNYPGAFILISHDKRFLDNCTNRTLEVENGKVFDYKTNYSNYLTQRDERRELLKAAYENQQRVIADKERTINRFMAKASKTKMAQSMQKQLDKMELIEMDDPNTDAMRLRFPPSPRSGLEVIKSVAVSKSYGPAQILDKIDFTLERGSKVAFVGQNGQGKTTLSRILVGEVPLDEGEVVLGHNVAIGYYAQDQANPAQSGMTVLQTIEAAAPPELSHRVRTILGNFMFSGDDVDKKVSVLSGGERARLALACLLLKPANLLILDEPTNHLDIPAKEVLKNALIDYDGSMIVVSHDRDFLQGLTDKTIEFRDKKLFTYEGDVEYFLSKRNVNDFVDIEKKNVAAPLSTAFPSDPKLDDEKKKQITKQIKNIESRIEQLEKDIKAIEVKMADPAFYDSRDSQKVLDQYKDAKSKLEEANQSWEELVEQV